MSVPVAQLLSTWKKRLGMQKRGVTAPPEYVKEFTKDLVSKLSRLDPDEMVMIDTKGECSRFIRELDGTVLAILDDPD